MIYFQMLTLLNVFIIIRIASLYPIIIANNDIKNRSMSIRFISVQSLSFSRKMASI